ncbi:MAG: hypothetical protein J6A97_07975 [Clostridia bacterium]|nr:hypothetical protein [Clostridia bacterium]
MKKSIKTVISFVLITLLALSFSSCSVFQSMRENALNASQTTIYATPEKDQIISEYNSLLALSLMDATEIKENVSYSAGKPDVFKAGEEAGVLDAAANQLKNFIMSANPGSASTVLEEGADSLLKSLDEAAVLNFDFTRNIATENVTDAKGNEAKDEDGNVITETRISDNILHLTFNFFATEPLTGEGVTNENGEADTEATTTIYAETATIESIFGSLKDKEAVLKNFENIKDYIVVSDYEIAYENCIITSDADLEEGRLNFVSFQKNMKVTAKAEGVGALAEYGEIEVVFNLTLNTNYEFSYAAADEEGETAEDTTAEDTTAEETAAAENDTATEETTASEEDTDTAVETTEEAVSEETTAA